MKDAKSNIAIFDTFKTRKNKATDKFIIRRRKAK